LLLSVSLFRPAAAAAALGLALFASTALAQQPPAAPEQNGPGSAHPRPPAPPPTNLKVLPKTLTGDQVRQVMHKWEGQLGVECNTCHAVDPTKKMPNGRPALNFADDSKPEKETARLMLKMTEEINQNYTTKVESKQNNEASAKEVTCGTCHRGKFDPAAYIPPPEPEHEHHDGPPPTGEKPAIPR
jgi:hypothetical protein